MSEEALNKSVDLYREKFLSKDDSRISDIEDEISDLASELSEVETNCLIETVNDIKEDMEEG